MSPLRRRPETTGFDRRFRSRRPPGIGAFIPGPRSCRTVVPRCQESGRVHPRHRRRSSLAVVAALFAVVGLAGCLDLYVAEVPSQYLTDGWHEADRGSGERWYGLAAQWAHVTYETDPPVQGTFDDGPYPASLSVMTIDTPGKMDTEEVSRKVEQQVQENARKQGLILDNASKRQGERDLASGVRSLYFTYDADVGEDRGLFTPGFAARVIGEVWFDEPEATTVVAVGLAQVEGGSALGPTFRDSTTWQRIVADPKGSIGEARADNGLIYNVRSHP